MTAISTAVNADQVSATVGYEIKGFLAAVAAGNLPIRVAVLAESNTANQAGLTGKLDFTTAKEVADITGYGSPAYGVARILRPKSGDKLGSIPTVLYPVAEAAGATATVITVGITGTATKTTTHFLKVNGRKSLDGAVYQFVVETGDTAAEIAPKMIDAINNVIGAPAIGTVVTDDAVFTSTWKGITSAELNVEVDLNGESAGLTYTENSKVDGAGVPSIANALAEFGEEWNVLVINAIGTDSTILDALEAFNGNPNDQTGRYVTTQFKPFISLFGDTSVDTLAKATAITDARKNENTNVLAAAPNSKGFSYEAPAEASFFYAPIAQNTPHLDPIGIVLKDTPGVDNAGDFSDASKRDKIVKIGSSTVKLTSEQYEIVDLVTTAHPDDEPQTAVLYRWVRDWIVNMNIAYKYKLKEKQFVEGKTIVENGQPTSQADTISPNQWKAEIYTLADQIESEALISDAQAMKDSTQVEIDATNANRLNTNFSVIITGVARVLSTTNQFTFNFGG